VKETDTELRIELAADVLFDFDKADILPKAETVLGAGCRRASSEGQKQRADEGTPRQGSPAYTKSCPAPADAVKNWLMRQDGLKRIQFVTAASELPTVAPNTKTAEATIRMAAEEPARGTHHQEVILSGALR